MFGNRTRITDEWFPKKEIKGNGKVKISLFQAVEAHRVARG
jgi:hypothetical protein